MLQWFTGLPLWAYITFGAVGMLGSGYAGWTIRDWKCDAAQTKVIRKEIVRYQKQTQVIHREAEEFEKEKEVARYKAVARSEQIKTIYRDRVVPTDCAVPDDARGVLVDAVREANTRAGGQFEITVPKPAAPPKTTVGPGTDFLGGKYNWSLWGVRFEAQADSRRVAEINIWKNYVR